MIEIEKKFLLTEVQEIELLKGSRELGRKIVTDSYLDTDDLELRRKDYWFRLRDGSYELKVPLVSVDGSATGTNRYHEITDIDAIAKELDLPGLHDFETEIARAGIGTFVTCFTDRRSYEKRGFHIDIDAATYKDSDFTYALAEIELLVDSESEADEAERSIIEFANEFGLKTDQIILGKIGSFIQSEIPEQYEVLVKAGVLKRTA